MKNVLFSLTAAAVLLLSGCSQKNPAIDDTMVKDEVIIDSGVQDTSGIDTSGMSMDQMMAKLKGELGTVYFGFDKFNIQPSMQPVVSSGARLLNQADASSFIVKLEGNCDEWGTDEYNMALGLKRAASVKQALISQGVDGARIQTVSFGKNNPVCTMQTKSCWAKNRRVNFDLLPQ